MPTLSLNEVGERVLQQRSENEALQVVALMQQGLLADSVMLATAREYDAALWTQDAHFKRIAGVK